MNKKLWVGGYLVSLAIVFAVIVIEAVLGILLYDEILHPRDVAIWMMLVGGLAYLQFVVVHTIITLVVLYKLWDVLQDGVTTVSPGKAIGFLFIPFFNIYWIFRTWAGYPKEHNDYLDRHQLTAPKLPGVIFTVFPVIVLLSAILVLPILVLPFVTLFLISRSCDAINNLLIARAAAAEGRPVSPANFVGTPENPRSRLPIFAFSAIFLLTGLLVIALGVFSWFNLFPQPSAEVLPPKVGDFTLQPGGTTSGSFLGRRSGFNQRMYLSETGGSKKALEYNINVFPSDSYPKQWITSMCSPSSAEVIKDSAGNDVAKVCMPSEALFLQLDNKTIRIRQPDGYELEKLKAAKASGEEILAFVKGLPLTAGLAFPSLGMPSTTTTISTSTTTSPSTSPAVSIDARPDLVMTADEYFKATNGKDKTELAKFNGKLIQVTARFYSTTSSSVMLQAGKDSFWGYFEPSEAGSFEKAQRDDRLTIKCVGEASFDLSLRRCVLVENKKIVSADDTPDVTFTADEYWKNVGSYELPSSVRSKKWDELRGKIIKVSGKVKDVSGDKANLAAGENSWFGCKPDPENAGMFSGLADGQNVTFLSVHGVASLEHCIVIRE